MRAARVAFLGVGNMGQALVRGALRAKALAPAAIAAYDPDSRALDRLRRATRVRAAGSASAAVEGSDYVFLCVKPQQLPELLAGIRGGLRRGQCLVSIAAGVRTGMIERAAGGNAAVVRVMPNTPALLGQGASAVAGGKFARPAHIRFVLRFFASVGKAVVLPEGHFDAVTAVSGSGPAYVFYLAESLEKAALELGLPPAEARLLARQTVAGAARMLEGGQEPADLRRAVTSPGGTTQAALEKLQSLEWQAGFVAAVRRAAERARELSGG